MSSPEKLREAWDRLHQGDQEPWPEERFISRLAREQAPFSAWVKDHGGPAPLTQSLREAWRQFHSGDFHAAIEQGSRLGALGATVANKAAAVHSLTQKLGDAPTLRLLDAGVQRGEAAVKMLPDYANAHYMLAMVLGRYSQGISILKALAEGLASRVRTHLDRALALEPRHAEAHVALALYHAEIVGKLGSFAAGLTYGATGEAALEHFRKAVKLAPHSPIVRIEYAHGLLLLDSGHYRDQARSLYQEAAAIAPLDAMERLDVERAKRSLE